MKRKKATKTWVTVSGKKYDAMIGRCYRESDPSYSRYSMLGIKVCSGWLHNIENFRAWLKLELSNRKISIEDFVENSNRYILDRIDGNSHYMPDNCRISTLQQQGRNRVTRERLTVTSAEGEEICI